MNLPLLFILLLFPGCMGWDGSPVDIKLNSISYENRISRWVQVFLDDLDFDTNGAQGTLTTICTGGYSHHGCTVSCSRDHSRAIFTCTGDSSTPTGFMTVRCGGDNFSQGFQGSATLTITTLTSSSVRMVLAIDGTLYILAKDGSYLSSGIWDKSFGANLIFQKTVGQNVSYLCEATSTVSFGGESQSCEALTFPFSCG